MFTFRAELWLIVLVCLVFYANAFSFVSLSKLYLIRKYALSEQLATLQQSLFFLTAVVGAPLFGKLVDMTGFHLWWSLGAVGMACAAHFLFLFSFVSSFVPVVLLGMALSLSNSAVEPKIITRHRLRTVFYSTYSLFTY